MSFLSDVAALARAGYKFEQVKELMSMNADTAEPAESAEHEEPAKSAESAEHEEPAKTEEPDYKAMYEAKVKELAEAQNSNINADIEDDNLQDDLDNLNDIFRSFM